MRVPRFQNILHNLAHLHVPIGTRKLAEGAPDFNKDKAIEAAREAEESDRRWGCIVRAVFRGLNVYVGVPKVS